MECIHAETACLDRLVEILDREREAVKTRDSDGLTAVTADKEAVLSELANHGQARLRLLEEAGCSRDEAGIEAFASGTDDPEAFLSGWRGLADKLTECQRRNQVNGQILAGTAEQTRRLLSLLLGSPSPSSEVYDRHGGKHSPLGGHTSTKA